jgi:hypothetical protein
MARLDDELTDRDYPWLITVEEAIQLTIDHLALANQSQDGLTLGVHLKMASRAMRCALEVYGMRLEKEKVE